MTINGRLYDHEDCRIMLPSGLAYGVTELNYSDEQDIEERYGRGAVPRGYGRKNYAASGSLVMDRDEWNILYPILANSGGNSFYDHKPFDIISSYANDNLGVTVDTLPQCKITKIDTSYKQGEANVSEIKVDFKILKPIKWNGLPAKKS